MLQSLAIQALPILLAVTLHEVAHGWVARRLGDRTAEQQGRLSLNPLVHVDPIGTVLFPVLQVILSGRVFFGWARPVPVDPRNFEDPRKGMMWVALGGPAANLAQAVFAGLLVHGLLLVQPELPQLAMTGATSVLDKVLVPIWLMSIYAIIINGVLMAFNLIPVPPLDGSRVAFALLPPGLARSYAELERYGMLIVMAIIFLVPEIISAVVMPAIQGLVLLLQIEPWWLSILP